MCVLCARVCVCVCVSAVLRGESGRYIARARMNVVCTQKSVMHVFTHPTHLLTHPHIHTFTQSHIHTPTRHPHIHTFVPLPPMTLARCSPNGT